MKKVKRAVWVVLIGLVAVLIYQNQTFFLAKQIVSFNLLFAEFQTPEMYTVFVCFGFLIAGLLLGLYFYLLYYLKSKKLVKMLNTTVAAQEEKVKQLEAQLASTRRDESYPQATDDMAPDTVAIQPDDKVAEKS